MEDFTFFLTRKAGKLLCRIMIKNTAFIHHFYELRRYFFINTNKIMEKLITSCRDLLNFYHSCDKVRGEFS